MDQFRRGLVGTLADSGVLHHRRLARRAPTSSALAHLDANGGLLHLRACIGRPPPPYRLRLAPESSGRTISAIIEPGVGAWMRWSADAALVMLRPELRALRS